MPLLLTNKTIDKLKYDLVREGLVELDGLNLAQEKAEKNATNLSVELIKENLLTENELLSFIQEKLHIPYVELSDYVPDINCLTYLSMQEAQKYHIFPLFKIEDVLTVAMSDPLDLFAINNLFQFNNLTIEPVVCSEISIKNAINKYYSEVSQKSSWQDRLISADIDDDILQGIISEIIQDAISNNVMHIYMERSIAGLNIFFEKELKGFIPSIIVTRFLFEFGNIYTNIDILNEDIPQKAKFNFEYQGEIYPIIISVFPTKYGSRISLNINKPLQEINEKLKEKLSKILKKNSIIAIKDCNDTFMYSLAQYLSEKHFVLMVENIVKYELPSVSQIEINKNTGIYFDDIVEQIELQNFDIIFFEKIYTKEQFEKLKLLSNERIVFTSPIDENCGEFDFCISKDGKIS